MKKQKLLVNPHVSFVTTEDKSKVIGFRCPVKGHGLIVSRFEDSPKLLKRAIEVIQSDGRSSGLLSQKDRERLIQRGILIHRNELCGTIRYFCDLNDHRKSFDTKLSFFSRKDYIPNPNLIYRKNGGVPPFFSDRLSVPAELDCSGPTVWTEDPFTKIIYPYLIRGQMKHTFEKFCLKGVSGYYSPADIDVLRRSRILLTKDDLCAAGEHLRIMATRHSAHMKQKKYVQLPSLLNPLHLSSLQQYFRKLREEGWLRPPVDHYRLRLTRHNDPIAWFFHFQMKSFFSNLMMKEYKPSFSAFATHQSGSRLWKHKDRPQGDLVCSLLMDYSPDIEFKNAWPLYLTVRVGGHYQKKQVKQRIGEVVAFRGTKVAHSRPVPLPQGHRSSHILFCFVPAEYEGPLD